MKTSILKLTLLVGATVPLLSPDLPHGWTHAGSRPKSYQMSIDKGAGQDSKNAATIKSIGEKIDGFGTLMQQSKPGKYLGKRIRMTGNVKAKDVARRAGLWLRVDQTDSTQPLSFDNMTDRPIKGTIDWSKYAIVLDIPNDASRIAYGAFLDGTGQIWFDDITFEIVTDDVATTGYRNNEKSMIQNEPINLDFEK